jgi:hypothetical protein
MRTSTFISIFIALVLATTSVASFAAQGQGSGQRADHRGQQVDRNRGHQADHDRTYDQDRMVDRERSNDRDGRNDAGPDRGRQQGSGTFNDQDIYGNALMTDAERKQYRNELGNSNTQESRSKVQAQHEKKMQERALQQGQDLVPPGQGSVYGGELMSVQERNEYREQLRVTDSDKERQRYQAEHRDQINQRAKALGLEVEGTE